MKGRVGIIGEQYLRRGKGEEMRLLILLFLSPMLFLLHNTLSRAGHFLVKPEYQFGLHIWWSLCGVELKVSSYQK